MNYNQKVSDYISQAPAEQIKMLESLRQLIHQSVNDTTEDIKWGMPVFKKNKTFTYLRFSAKHVTLGFYNIDRIKDPMNILEGDGETMRHVKIFNQNDINTKQFAAWLIATAD